MDSIFKSITSSSSTTIHNTADITDINELIKNKDFDSLKDIGISTGFTDNNTTRLKSWSILLGCGGIDVYDSKREGSVLKSISNKDKSITDNTFTDIIGRDIKRNGYSRWNKTSTYSDYQKKYDLEQIEKLLNVVFTEYEDFNYIQSFDSVFALFYLIANGNLFIAKKLIVSYLHIFKSDLSLKSDNFGQLPAIWSILKKYDYTFYKWLLKILDNNEDDVSFALEWYISWFSHSSIKDFALILRIYDFMISTQNQQIGLYMVVAMMLINKEKMMNECESLTDFILFTKDEIKFDEDFVSELIKKCHVIMTNERKEERRKEIWKRDKMEMVKAWKEIKKASKILSNVFLSVP